MIVYNKTLLENTFMVSEAIQLKDAQFIDAENLNDIKQKLETLKTSRNIFARLGFFLLGTLLFSSIFGLFMLISLTSNNDSIDEYYLGILFSIIGIVLLELICNINFFRHGIDDVFLIGTQLSIYSTVYLLSESEIFLSITMIIIGLLFCIRYVSTLSFLVSLAGIVFFIGLIFVNYTTITAILPFVILGISIGFYFMHKKFKNNEKLYFYNNVMDWFYIFSLILGYASINYLIVRALSEDLMNQDYTNSNLPFGWLFYALMFSIPVFYIVFSLKIKDRTMLYIGALTFVLSIATHKYYFSSLPAEWALIIAGSTLFGLVYFSIQKIKNNATGITFKPDVQANTAMLSTVEALIINSQDVHNVPETPNSEMPFGGGGFSGGGAGESF